MSRGFEDRSIRHRAGSSELADFQPSDEPELLGTGITAAAVRLPLGRWLDEWVRTNQQLARAALRVGANESKVAAFVKQFETPIRRGRPPLTDVKLRTVAEAYQDAVAAGDRAPAKAVWRQLQALGLHDIKPATVRSWVRAARLRGFFDEETAT